MKHAPKMGHLNWKMRSFSEIHPDFSYGFPIFSQIYLRSGLPPTERHGFCEAHGSGGDDWSQLPEPRGGRAQLGAVLHRGVGAHLDAASVAESGVPGGDAGAQGKRDPMETKKRLEKMLENLMISFGSSKLGESEVT